jgi:hypothetical protein
MATPHTYQITSWRGERQDPREAYLAQLRARLQRLDSHTNDNGAYRYRLVRTVSQGGVEQYNAEIGVAQNDPSVAIVWKPIPNSTSFKLEDAMAAIDNDFACKTKTVEWFLVEPK